MENLPALALSVVLIIWAGWMRALSGTWLQPGAMFALWWCFAGILPLLLSPDPVTVAAITWVIASVVVVSIASVIGNGGFRTKLREDRPEASATELRVLSAILTVSVILGIGSSFFFALGSGVAFADLLDIERLVVVSNQLYVARYAEPDAVAAAPPRLSQALLPFVYLAPAIGGYVLVLRKSWLWRLISIASLLPAIVVTVLQTTKAAVLFSGTLWISSYLTARLRKGNLRVFSRGHILVGVFLGLTVTVFFFAVGLARLASTDTAMLDIVRVKLVTAAFGHMSVFSQWFTEYLSGPYSPTLGEFTFAGPRELLGIQQRVPGVFGTVVDLIAGETSNIFTGFRPLIQDFTIPGALVMLSVLGFVAGYSFRMVAAGNWGASPVLAASYMTMLWTPITWFWIYNSLTVSVFAIGALVVAIRVWQGSVGQRNLTADPASLDPLTP
jgi:oligosaccharide repeat unit polymerase